MARMNGLERKKLHEGLWHRCTVRECHYCGAGITRQTATLDHKKARTRGGSDDRSNLVLSCKPCNSEKGSGDYEAFKAHKLPIKQARRAGLPLPFITPFEPPVFIKPKPIKASLKLIKMCGMASYLTRKGWAIERLSEHYEVDIDIADMMRKVGDMGPKGVHYAIECGLVERFNPK